VIAGALVVLASVLLLLVRRGGTLLLWVFWLCGTLGFVTALDLMRNTNQLTYSRYTSLAAPALCALIASLGTLIARPVLLRGVLPFAGVIFALVLWPTAYTRENEPEWRGVGKVIQQHVRPDDVLIFASGAQVRWYHEILYLGAAHYDPTAFPRPIVRLVDSGPPTLSAQLAGRSAWLISGPLDRPLDQLLPGAQLVEQYELPGLEMFTHVTFPAAPATGTAATGTPATGTPTMGGRSP
jgi:hypothetical protein